MNCIVAVDKNWGIGNKGRLLVSIPADMKFFREETLNKVVVMGQKTLESFPAGKPLKKRINIVLSDIKGYRENDPDVKDGTLIVKNSLEELLEELKKYDDDQIYVIGGASVYRLMLPYCKVAHITKIDQAYEADTYFPNLDEMPEWQVTGSSDEQTYFDLEYRFLKYERI